MRLTFLVVIAIVAQCMAEKPEAKKANSTKLSAVSAIPTGDNREKRTIKTFSSYNSPPQISKRISTGYQSNDQYVYNTQPFNQLAHDPLVPDYVRDFDAHESNSINNEAYHQQYNQIVHQRPTQYHHTQYLEAPEPIIEIIIKESNETLPIPQAQVAQPPSKNKKEQVQVFYVKYQKDDHKGLVIDDPVAALSPSAYHQESNEDVSNEEVLQDNSYAATPAPPVKTTTLRTIIHPDSERYHSNSGIQVTFNSEDKTHSSSHQYQEHIEASDLQPVVAHQSSFPEPRFQPRPTTSPSFHSAQQQHQFQQGGSRNFDFQSRFDNRNQFHAQSPPPQFNPQQPPQRPQHQPLSLHQELPNPQSPSQAFRSEPSFSPAQRPPPNRFAHQPQHQQAQQHQPPPQHHQQLPHFQSQPHHQPPPPPQHFEHQQQFSNQPPKFRVPQPIPVHNIQQQQPLPSLSRPPQFANHAVYNQEFQTNQQQSSTLDQYRVRPQPQQQPLAQHPSQNQYRPQQHLQSQSQPQQYNPQPQSQRQQSLIRPSQPLNEFTQGGGLVQGPAPNLSQQSPPQGHDFVGKIVPGAELLPSVSKFEQHITQTVPFGQPIRPFDQPAQRPVAQPLQQPQPPQQIVQPTLTQYQNYHTEPQAQPESAIHQEEAQQFEKEFFQHQQERQQQQLQQQKYHQQPKQQAQQHHFQQPQEQYRPKQQYSTSNIQSSQHFASKPVQQPLVPGQSVSTLASEVFPKLENQLKQQQHQQQYDYQTQSRNRDSISATLTKQTVSPPTTTTIASTTQASPTAAPTKKVSKAQFDLPDEVPDDLRAQLLSSGILDNADISVLDYDKIGDVPIESLPAEHLANFYGGGGAAQLSSSNKVVTVVKPNGDTVLTKKPGKTEVAIQREIAEETGFDSSNEQTTLPRRQNVDLKVVRFDSHNQKSVTDKYIRSDSTVLPSVDLSEEDRQYNRYLPLKVNGAQFPYPDAKELKGRKISSVVVLAPVDNQTPVTDSAEARFERDIVDTKQIKFVAGDSLKQLLKKPTKENFKRWLDKESKTDVDLQSVVLLVTKNDHDGTKEIYMYDISTQHVSKLSGELSSAFVNVAEENATAQDIENSSISDSGIIEQMAPQSADIDANNDASESIDSDSESSRIVETFVLPPNGNPTISKQSSNIQINSGYSVIS